MKYKGKDYDDNQMLELLNSMEQQISDGASKLQGAEEKIKSYETQITDLNNDISNSSNSTIYATILQFSGSKYYLNLSDDDSLNNGTCQLYFMCF